jgi:redox-sensitive bicupin YhaK (pirin superfamily)
VAKGAVELNGQNLAQGDGAAISEDGQPCTEKSLQVLLFDLA